MLPHSVLVYFLDDFCLYVYKGYCSIIPFSCDAIVWLLYQGNYGLIECVRNTVVSVWWQQASLLNSEQFWMQFLKLLNNTFLTIENFSV